MPSIHCLSTGGLPGQTPTLPVSAVARTDAWDRGVVSFQHWMPGDVAILVNVICTHTRQKRRYTSERHLYPHTQKTSLYEWTLSAPTHGKKRRYTSERYLYTHTAKNVALRVNVICTHTHGFGADWHQRVAKNHWYRKYNGGSVLVLRRPARHWF